MCDNILINKRNFECPICEKNHEIEQRQRTTQALFKDTIVEYIETYFTCLESDSDENEFVPAYLMDVNLLKIRDAYRIEKGLLTS